MNKNHLIAGSLFGALAVALGAFAAHGLKKIVAEETVSIFQTGVQYQMYHSLALLLTAVIFERFPYKWVKWSGNCFIAGIILFSGSLYLLTAFKVNNITGMDAVGIITPLGGLLFITGWLFLFIGVMKKK
jgi:uncharacterized membrane protein YgdD (TMEM256/DUF423 family)